MPDIFRGIGIDPLPPGNTFYLLWMILGFLVATSVLVVSLGRLGRHVRPGADVQPRLRHLHVLLAAADHHLDDAARRAALYLVIMRIFQGVGAAFLIANSSAILTDAFPEDQRGMALGINQVAGISGSFIGLVLGGLLAPISLAADLPRVRAHRALRHRLGLPQAAGGARQRPRQHRLAGQHHLRPGPHRRSWSASPTASSPTAGTPWGGRARSCSAAIGSAWPCWSPSASSRPGCRTRCSSLQPVQDPGLHRRQPLHPAGRHRAGRPHVHADHLAPGDLAAPARLRLRPDAAVGGHLHAAPDRRVPHRRAHLRPSSRTSTARVRSPPAACLAAALVLRPLGAAARSTSPTWSSPSCCS